MRAPDSLLYATITIVMSACAGGLGWGIRGQYGHETGAMIAGLLVGLVLTLRLLPNATALRGAQVVALITLGVSVGGSMTYGQTVGLTHDGPLIGNWAALRWGMLGLAVKGGIWIGFAGLFLGIALSRRNYPPVTVALLLAAAIFVWFFGVQTINNPYNPGERELPAIFFSDHWQWEPDGELEPRFESWGGLLSALVMIAVCARVVMHDQLALRLALWGCLAGAVGFPAGPGGSSISCLEQRMVSAPLGCSVAPLFRTTGHTTSGRAIAR